MGRPKTPADQYKGTYIRVRVTKRQRAEILRKSIDAKAKTESEWIRQRLLSD